MYYSMFLDKHKSPLSHAQWLRLRYIERQLLWERKVTSRMIAEEFGVSAQQARTDVRTYMEVAPGNAIEKGAGRKGYFPSTTFTPVLLGDNDLVWRATVEFQPPQAAHAQEIPLIHRAVHSRTLAIFLSAIEQKGQVKVTYASMENPEGISRTLSPTVIITVNGRQHVRAYDWGSSAFKDFVLARFLDSPELIVPAPLPPRKDTAWEVVIPVRFIANPTLNKAQQEVIKRDYILEPSEFSIRAPMIFYLCPENNLPKTDDEYAQATDASSHGSFVYPVLAVHAQTGEPIHKYRHAGER
ncbi:TPA: WYL domain-containing protein [Enterobacter hormaechei]|uniref:WYL domain-containing protein n=1 Tax=Enterobacter cloacae complex TaxID=354276 RepID=UPI001F399BF4|nr:MULTISPECIES: WYL domain-containing protein [Enterobacter cloacae complex]HAV1482575.1 WYL domain-containing protein [Enterobacter hormaechei subsp. steigerwaltii]MCM7728067.1 WYL domain-containing protein [Enterobacter hormaechei]HAV1485849.1 WYL domain-containing protein [Enterobacter hormaechei subsp. steigerwaltii]HEM7461893.1 WYL domain-containing protein [Enterobacter hormaechei]HEM7464216.1 WYL domain-containing protein [Enterobacter hormaechei]